MTNARAETTSPIEDDSYDADIRLCDDSGMVSHESIKEERETLDKSYLERHTRLAGPTNVMGDKRKGWPFTEGEGWQCTGHAHYQGLHLRCISPAHNRVSVGSSVTLPQDPNIHRCPHCFQELVPMDIGYGDSIRLACPEHGWKNRYPVLSVPRWLEADIQQFPRAYEAICRVAN